MPKKTENLQQMVDMLKQGATLTEYACPACSSPLFRFQAGELWCAQCKKRVIVVKEGEDAAKVTRQSHLGTLEKTVMTKIQTVEQKIREEQDVEELQKLNTVLASLLENLEKLKRMKN